MTAVLPTQPEIVARLREIHTARKAFNLEEGELLALLEGQKQTKDRPVLLTFGKNVMTWGEGQALVIKGKGYKFVKALYEAKKMRLKRERLGRLVWNDELVNQKTFVKMVYRLAEKLERTRFPYRLMPLKSKERVEVTDEYRNDKFVKKRIQSEIIGVKLDKTTNCLKCRR